ncbi:hypothetical protein BN8_03640 [Fibrisoma limi BUZ 3]|uniref:Uncharacterized protein n=1 Tax=Fibrisoma limi BUZ 3 TaxID=1185876 RepID=I2GKP1_9BACT|nr:hypothetical protein BN8_03640 [Fibrisoma limi BUZ 3]
MIGNYFVNDADYKSHQDQAAQELISRGVFEVRNDLVHSYSVTLRSTCLMPPPKWM